MSDYRPGPWCAIWDGLFWNFIDQHHDFFKGQYRLSMMAKTWEKMDAAKRDGHLRNAMAFLGS
jgi:deoxyribodipyrimidine photolyase-related protein